MITALSMILVCQTPAVEEKEKEPTFAETSESLLGGTLIQYMEHWHVPHFRSWHLAPGLREQKAIRNFSTTLIEKLSEDGTADQKAATKFFTVYLGIARNHADIFHRERKDDAVNELLGPDRANVLKCLEKALQSRDANTRWNASLAILATNENHSEASKVIAAVAKSPDAVKKGEALPILAISSSASSSIVSLLQGLIDNDDDKELREIACGIVINIGPPMRALVPSLIALLDKGDRAKGSYSPALAIALPIHRNLAVGALSSIGRDAEAAVPALIRRFAKSDDDERLEILECLINIRSKSKDFLALLDQELTRDNSRRLNAAVAMLCIDPDHQVAHKLVASALRNVASQDECLVAIRRFGPPSKKIVEEILPMLNAETESKRKQAAWTMARIGTEAANAVDSLEQMMLRQQDGSDHTFQSNIAACRALRAIGGKAAAAALLRIARSDAGGEMFAMLALPNIDRQFEGKAIELLVETLDQKNGKAMFAAVSLCNFGSRARSAEAAFKKKREDQEIEWILDTAIRRLNPAK